MMFSFALAFFFTLGFCVAAIGQTSPRKDFPGIKISNFGKMDDRFYRGARPKADDYVALKALGIKTVIDLQEKPKGYEKAAAEAAGLRYVNIPIADKSYPKQEQLDAFLKLLDDPETGVFFAHCAGGRHRTGNIGALYRFTKYGWGFDQAYQEMKNYDFYTRWGHGKQKDFVVDYAAKMDKERELAASKGSESTATVSIAPND